MQLVCCSVQGNQGGNCLSSCEPLRSVFCIDLITLLLGNSQHCLCCVGRKLLQWPVRPLTLSTRNEEGNLYQRAVWCCADVEMRHSQVPLRGHPSASCRAGDTPACMKAQYISCRVGNA